MTAGGPGGIPARGPGGILSGRIPAGGPGGIGRPGGGGLVRGGSVGELEGGQVRGGGLRASCRVSFCWPSRLLQYIYAHINMPEYS